MTGFDVIALGPDLATTLTAALLARRGRRVLLAPGRDHRLRVRHGPHLLGTRHELLCGLTRPLVRRVLAELGLDAYVQQRLVPHRPAFQLVLPGVRLDVTDDDEQLADELERELALPPAETERLLFQLARASLAVERLEEPGSPWPRGPAPDGLAGVVLPADRSPLHAMVTGPAEATAPCGRVGPLATARLWSSWRQGGGTLAGGTEALELVLHEQILSAGGEIMADADPEGMLTGPDGTPRGVVLDGRPGAILARGFVLGLPPDRLARETLLGPRPWLPRLSVAGWRCTLHLLFRRGWLPPSMGRLVLLQPNGGPPVLAQLDDSTLTSDEVVLSMTATIQGDPDLPRVEARILEAARGLVPFFDDAFVDSCSPHRQHNAPLDPVFALPETSSPLAGAPALPLDPGLGNTALVHPLVLGALGTEGAFVTAAAAADLLESV